jgi:hypothetical protein
MAVSVKWEPSKCTVEKVDEGVYVVKNDDPNPVTVNFDFGVSVTVRPGDSELVMAPSPHHSIRPAGELAP